MATAYIKVTNEIARTGLGFIENQHDAFFCDVMIHVCGVDVTQWVTGSVSITLAGRDGMNSCSFTLNNAYGNFVLTPRNLRDPKNEFGTWRGVLGKGSAAYNEPAAAVYSEQAKFAIFQYKNTHPSNIVNGETYYEPKQRTKLFAEPEEDPVLDKIQSNLDENISTKVNGQVIKSKEQFEEMARQGLALNKGLGSRMWPLDPHRAIFHKNDPVRIFYHNPLSPEDEWLPAFTGYVESYPWDDNYENGESTINISCSDIRILMQRMRWQNNPVSFSGSPVPLYLESQISKVSATSRLFKDYLADSGPHERPFVNQRFPEIMFTLTLGSRAHRITGIGGMRLGTRQVFSGGDESEASAVLEPWHTLGLLGYDRVLSGDNVGGFKVADELKPAGLDELRQAIDLLEKAVEAAESGEDQTPYLLELTNEVFPDLPGAAKSVYSIYDAKIQTAHQAVKDVIYENNSRIKEIQANLKSKEFERLVSPELFKGQEQEIEDIKQKNKVLIEHTEALNLVQVKTLYVKFKDILAQLEDQHEKHTIKIPRTRPYTYAEAQTIGRLTTWGGHPDKPNDGAFAPDRSFVHFLAPSTGNSSPFGPLDDAAPDVSKPQKQSQDGKIIVDVVEPIYNDFQKLKKSLTEKLAKRVGAMRSGGGTGGGRSNLVEKQTDRMLLEMDQELREFAYNTTEIPKSILTLDKNQNLEKTTRDQCKTLMIKPLMPAGTAEENILEASWSSEKYQKLREPKTYESVLASLLSYGKKLISDAALAEDQADEAEGFTYYGQNFDPNKDLFVPGSRITSRIQTRNDPMNPSQKQDHWGYDLAVEGGTKIYSPHHLGQGKVVTSSSLSPGYGAVVKIRYEAKGVTVVYGHVSPKLKLSVGSVVDGGAEIGSVGTTEELKELNSKLPENGQVRTTGDHLHIEAWRDNGMMVDPLALAGGIVKSVGRKSIKGQAANPATKSNVTSEFDAFDFDGLVQVSMQEVLDNSEIEWSNRLELINEFCTKLDYQWWVSPFGDIFFEFPMADFNPKDFGQWSRALTFKNHIKSGNYNDEATEVPTVLKIQGAMSENVAANQAALAASNGTLETAFLVVPNLVMRLGVNMETESFPHVIVRAGDVRPLVRWGIIDFQRKLSAATTFENSIEWRPFLLPNRPVHSTIRDRIGLVNSISHSLEINGICTSQFNTIYVRVRDANSTGYTNIFGTASMPVNYRELMFFSKDCGMGAISNSKDVAVEDERKKAAQEKFSRETNQSKELSETEVFLAETGENLVTMDTSLEDAFLKAKKSNAVVVSQDKIKSPVLKNDIFNKK